MGDPVALKDRLLDPNSPDRRPRRAAYALPTLFTAGNIFLGYISILRSFEGAMLAASGSSGGPEHFAIAAKAIGASVFLDGLDGRIARMTNTTSEFGKEMDSLADVISFGLAPAILAFAWGVQFVGPALGEGARGQLFNLGYFIAFLFLLCGAVRLARFNVTKNPIPKNPGRPDRKYFVGLPIPAAAAMVAAVVFALDAVPLTWWPMSLAWLGLLALLGFLMVSTWRYYSFKGINLSKPYTPLLLILLGAFVYGVLNYSKPVLLAMAVSYVASGIIIRIGGVVRRRLRHSPPPPHPEHQIG
jgi:CDP-diacylglycerol--serine O-phosphatidyltransferase